jgi:hypothetical protein
MNDQTVPVSQAVPVKRPVPPPIDPQKFLGGANVEKLKNMLKDVEEFTASVKVKGAKFTETLDMLHTVTVRFAEVVERMDRVISKMEEKNG